jgi:hypothetical protein
MRQVISIFLSILLLASSTGITYAQHYCGEFEMLAEVTLGEKHLSCGMAMEMSSCDDALAKDHKCCDNEYTTVDTDDNFTKANFNIDFQQPIAARQVSISELLFVLDTEITQSIPVEYHPPPLYKDIPVLYETFLI